MRYIISMTKINVKILFLVMFLIHICLAPSMAQTSKSDQADELYKKGLTCYMGQGVAKDLKLAKGYFEQAGRLGHPDACFALGVMYAGGEGVASKVV